MEEGKYQTFEFGLLLYEISAANFTPKGTLMGGVVKLRLRVGVCTLSTFFLQPNNTIVNNKKINN
jgi:hypothetical protein